MHEWLIWLIGRYHVSRKSGSDSRGKHASEPYLPGFIEPFGEMNAISVIEGTHDELLIAGPQRLTNDCKPLVRCMINHLSSKVFDEV